MQTVTKTIALHHKQQQFCRSQATYRAFVGGRGAGKTWTGSYDLIRRAKRGRTYMVIGPTYPNLVTSSFPMLVRLGFEMGVLQAGNVRKSGPPHISLSTGAEILFRTAEDPDKLRGANLSGAWLDEASIMSRDVYDIVIASLREHGEQGWLSATFTPKGVAHWTYELWGNKRKDTEVFHSSTSDNPFNPPEFYSLLKSQYRGAFASQELEGQFVADDEINQVIPSTWIRQSMDRWKSNPDPKAPLSAVGVDVARGGEAKTVLARRYGNWFAELQKVPGKSTPDGPAAAALVIAALREQPTALACVDVIGVGSSVADHLRGVHWVRCLPVNFAESAKGNTDSAGMLRFVNLRAYAYWTLRELLDPARDDKERLILPPDNELLADLSAPRWSMQTNGVKIEPKDDIAARLGRSPDCGDACALAVLLPRRNNNHSPLVLRT